MANIFRKERAITVHLQISVFPLRGWVYVRNKGALSNLVEASASIPVRGSAKSSSFVSPL
jgi:hypothetical protein